MKNFSSQYVTCVEEGFTKAGPTEKFKDHPELLPPPWHRAAKAIAEALKKDPDAGLRPILCLRFGGKCSGAHRLCREMRGMASKLIE